MSAREKKKILFVDDEPYILMSIERMLRCMREDWDMCFVSDGQEAMERLAGTSFDVVVADKVLPGVDGEEILATARILCPGVVCFLLSGCVFDASVLPVGHGTIAKPCTRQVLINTIGTALACARAETAA